MEKYRSIDERIRIINNDVNQKLPKSLNVGFRHATGQYWTWTSDDNMYHRDCILEMIRYLDNNDNIVLLPDVEKYTEGNC